MKQNAKFFAVVIALILLASAILTGCMYAIAADNGEMKPYNLNGQKTDPGDGNTEGENVPAEREPENNIIEDGPTSQKPLQSKFGEYLHQKGDSVIIFSAEQYAQLKEVRESGERIPLSYEEILYLVDDSIGMYFKYDTISLSNANVDGILPFTLTFSAIQSSSSCIINPYHGDFSEFESYADALRQYERMLGEIYAIIYYRIYMHDAGFADITRSFDEVIAPSERGDFYEENKHVSSILLTNIYQMLAIDGSAVGGIENGDKLAGEFQKVAEWEKELRANGVDPDKKFQSLNAPILCTEIWHNERTPLEHRFYIYESSEALQIVFPTKELTAMKPRQTVTYQAGEEGELQPIVHLNYLTGGARISAGVEFSFAMTGSFRLEDGVLKVYFGESESNPDYWYVFYETEEGFVYSAENSKPESSIGRDWADGLVFKKYRESTVVQPEIDPPANDEKDPNEGWAYLKYDAGSDYCSLMSHEGSSVIDGGSYVKEDDKLVFMFKTADGVYTYYFRYHGNNRYTYAKELSDPMPNYGFEDEMKFVLTVFDDCSSCFLEVTEE